MSSDDYEGLVRSYWESSRVNGVLGKWEGFKPEMIEDWKRIARIYAPSGNEVLRAEYITERFREYGVDEAYIDDAGSAVGVLQRGEGPTIAFIATMDDLATVADLVKSWSKPIEEVDGKLLGPGTNSSATCVSLLGLVRLLVLPGVSFKGRIYFVACVQEETGLTGIRSFLSDHPGEIDYVAEVGGGVGRVSYGAIGIHWFKVHYTGPRAHTLQGPGPNVTKGVAKSVTRMFNIPMPPDSYLNIAMLGAGKVYNHRSDDGWHSVDLRSKRNDVLLEKKDEVMRIAAEVAEEEGLEWWIEPFSEQQAGQIPGAKESKLVRVAEEITKIMGYEPRLSDRASSNMNASIAAGISTIGAGGERGAARDTPDEYANVELVLTGVKLHFLIGYIMTNGDLDAT